MILEYMKNMAEKYLGQPVDNAVVTVPAYFNDQQRQATKDAGAICKLNILRVINEPTAAAICYGLNNTATKEKKILIFDCGGGTQDVSLLEIDEGVIEVVATSGDSHLGGEDFDNRLVQHCIREFKTKHKMDIGQNDRAVRRLKTACERAKRSLSSSTQANIEIDSLHEGLDFQTTLTRARFENLCADLFQKCINPVETVLKDAGIAKNQVDEIVLVGGSTRVPKIQEMLSAFFHGKKLNNSVNPDEAVAYGAAVQANILSGKTTSKTENLVLLDVCSLSLGLETSGQIMTPMIPRNTTIPTKKTQTFSTYSDNQPAVTLKILEGERKFAKDCNLLGEFTLNGIPPAPRGVPQIEITYDLDANGILKITAVEKGTGKSENLEVDSNKSQLSAADIERMVQDSEKFKEEDELKGALVEQRNRLEQMAIQAQSSIQDSTKVTENEKNTIKTKCEEVLQWLKTHNEATKEEMETKTKELEAVTTPIMTKLYADVPESEPTSNNTGPTVEEVD